MQRTLRVIWGKKEKKKRKPKKKKRKEKKEEIEESNPDEDPLDKILT